MRCLYCYKKLAEGQVDFHQHCAKKMFGSAVAPVLPYTRAEISDLAAQVIRSQITITGVQAKLSLSVSEERGGDRRFTIVGLWGRYILKPQTDAFKALPELEDLTMHLAEIAKVRVVPHSLIRFADGELCYITRRIDRGAKGEKYPMEDMCQISERLTEYKYKGSYEQIAKLITKHSSTPKLDVVNFWEQVIFSWIIGNADMHLKNFSLYEPTGGNCVLTPGYDMLSTAMVMPDDIEELALTLNGKKRKIDRSDFEIVMKAAGLEPKIIENIFLKLYKAKEKWFDFIDESFLPSDMQVNYKTLIERRLNDLKY